MLKNTEHAYGIVAKGFHWVMFFMLSFSIVAGNLLASMPKGPEKLQAAGMHKSFGVILLLLILLRLAWKLINTTPKPAGGSAIENLLAHGMHWALYVLMFAQPISGILMTQSTGFPVSVFGLFELPVFVDKNPSSAELFRDGHGLIWVLMLVAVLGHIGAAMFHHFIRKDEVLKSMTAGARA